jgi:phytoene dehydrogenase-like protein
VLQTPPNRVQGSWIGALPELIKVGKLGNRMRKLSLASQRELLDLFTKSAGDYLDGWFESAPIKAAYGFDSIVGNYASPYSPGSAYVLLHHVFGEVNGKKGAWGHAIGGHGRDHAGDGQRRALARRRDPHRLRRARSAAGKGPRHRRGHRQRRTLAARVVRVEPESAPALHEADRSRRAAGDFLRRMEGWRCGSGTFRMNVALSELPDFSCLPGKEAAEHHGSGIIIAPSLQYMERAYHDARAPAGRASRSSKS